MWLTSCVLCIRTYLLEPPVPSVPRLSLSSGLFISFFFFLYFSRSQRQKTFEVDDTQWRLKKSSEAHRGWLLQLLELVLPPSCGAPSHSLLIIALKARGQNQQKFGKRGRNFFGQLAGLHKSHWTLYTRKKMLNKLQIFWHERS